MQQHLFKSSEFRIDTNVVDEVLEHYRACFLIDFVTYSNKLIVRIAYVCRLISRLYSTQFERFFFFQKFSRFHLAFT